MQNIAIDIYTGSAMYKSILIWKHSQMCLKYQNTLPHTSVGQ